MAILSPDQAVVDTLQSAVTLFRANLSTFIPDIYAFESSEAQTEIQNWWSNANNTVVIQEGFTNQKIQGLAWNVVLGADQEIKSRQPIGSIGSVSGGVVTQVTDFSTGCTVACLGPNKNWLRWSQMLCKWALLYYRQTMQNQYGLMDQAITAGPLQPVPDDLRDAVMYQYMRTVTLTAEHIDSWDMLAQPTITSASVAPDPVY